MLLVAILPIVIPLILLAVFKLSARLTMTVTAIFVLLAAALVWGMYPEAILASSFQGVHRALTIIWILLGAVTLLYTVKNTGAFARIREGFMRLSSDMRVQVVIIGFAFLALLEGVSGFGTPAVIVAPLLIALGFRPVVAAVIALVSDTVACTFGAVATPLYVGLENISIYGQALIDQVGRQVSMFDLVIGTLMPLALIYILVVWFGEGDKKSRRRSVLEVAPWALFIGAVYSLSAFTIVRTLGVDFASVLAGLISLIVAIVTARFGFLLPKGKPAWRQNVYELSSSKDEPEDVVNENMTLWQAWSPYIIVILLLILSRMVPAVQGFLQSNLDLSWLNILGFESIGSSWQLLYSPGSILLFGALMGGLIQSRSLRPIGASLSRSIKTGLISASALIPTLIMVQVFVNSGLNSSDFASMPVYIGELLGSIAGSAWVVFAPLFGSLGAFISGSTTVSTLTLGAVQESIALAADLPLVLILAMQISGAAAGNVIAIHNVVAVATVVGLAQKEGYIIRRTVPVVAVYVAVVGLLGLLTLILTRI